MSQASGSVDPAVALRRRLWRAVARRFAERQASHGLTQADLSRALGAPRSQVNVWLNHPDRMTLRAGARLLAAMEAEVSFVVRTAEGEGQ